ncbi:MAG TPA: hypothetical protein VGB24_15495 [Longimicrobium sp.]|jgi:hypothetical protein|uniref:hypothetical protein n=1 Tax=Longimicrobium sp. TaxID=2029185 RepID=UPI002EDB8A38
MSETRPTDSRSRWKPLAIACGALAVLASACDGGRQPALTDVRNLAPALSHAEAQAAGEAFARALARAMDQPGLRATLHRAMRESRFNEHKLVLQAFAETPGGGRMVKAMAAANGVEEETVRGWIAQLPRMDFYVPFSEHRRAWAGSGDVVVGSNMRIDETRFTGYAPDGSALQFDTRAGTPSQTVIFLHPAEPKAVRRPTRSATTAYAGIEDPSAQESTITMVDAGDAEPNLNTNPVATFLGVLYSFKNYRGDGIGGIELMVKHYAGMGGTKIDEQIMDEDGHFGWDGFTYDEVTTPYRGINFATYGVTWIKVYERDSGIESPWNNDDFWGEGAFGGFNVKHRFYTAGVVYLDPADPCYTSPAAGGCPSPPNVDIVYQPDPNQPGQGTGGFTSGDLSNFATYGTFDGWRITNGYMTATGSTGSSVQLRQGVTIADGWVETETDQAVDGGLVVRAQSNGSSHYLLAIRDDSRYGHANIQIYKAVNGSYTSLSPQVDLSFPRGITKKIRFEAVGTTLKAYFDGTLVAQATDATFTSGLLGFRVNHVYSADQTRYAVLRWSVVSPTDNFNDAASLNNYTLINTPEAWSVSGGHLVAGTGARQAIALRNGVNMVNGWVETKTDQAADAGLVLRAQSASSYYLLAIRDDSRFGHSNIEIYKALNGTFTPLTQQVDLSFPVGTQKTIRFEASGTTLKAYVNGSLVAQASDASFTSGQVGLRANGRDGESLVSRFDLFSFSQQ